MSQIIDPVVDQNVLKFIEGFGVAVGNAIDGPLCRHHDGGVVVRLLPVRLGSFIADNADLERRILPVTVEDHLAGEVEAVVPCKARTDAKRIVKIFAPYGLK